MADPLILVPCGTGVATSTMAADKVKRLLRDRGISVQTRACLFKELGNLVSNAALIVSIAPYMKMDYKIRVVSGIPFLTGVGIEEAVEEIVAILTGGTKK